MGERKIVEVGLNRVEGDLELRIELEDGRVTDAWCIGTMFRGFEQILKGRAATDGIVITPRICGLCNTAHQYAAVAAVERAIGCAVAPDGIRVRNACLMTEELQSDARHTFLLFAADLCHPRYEQRPLQRRVRELFEPFLGSVYRDTIRQTKDLVKIIALFGGQWPHSSYMVPGGVTVVPERRLLVRAQVLLDAYQRWYEQSVLGCSSERWLAVESADDLERWLSESEAHANGALGVIARFGREIGLTELGRGAGNLLSYGGYFDPERWKPADAERACLRAPGFYDADERRLLPLEPERIEEHVRYSWFVDYEGGKHPFEGETVPDYSPHTEKYTWVKAPRYRDKVAEVNPLADLVAAGDPLTTSLFSRMGSSAWLRELVRLHRPVLTLRLLRQTLSELLAHPSAAYYVEPDRAIDGEGAGLVSAARGALGHWVRLRGGKIEHYQVITPTAWNASPRDSAGRHGHWESTLVGTRVADEDDPLELAHIVRSHDPCLVCTVHFLESGKSFRFGA